jgi:hypothetical protein
MYTEHDQQLDVGDGFWKTVEGVGNYKHIFADPKPARWLSWAPCARPALLFS